MSSDYKVCMARKMGSGVLKGLDKDTRRITFCALAKECSKGVSHDEAMKICASQPPKPPGEKKSRRSKVAECVCPEAVDLKKLTAKCEIQLGRLAGMGQLSPDSDIAGICQTILG